MAKLEMLAFKHPPAIREVLELMPLPCYSLSAKVRFCIIYTAIKQGVINLPLKINNDNKRFFNLIVNLPPSIYDFIQKMVQEGYATNPPEALRFLVSIGIIEFLKGGGNSHALEQSRQ